MSRRKNNSKSGSKDSATRSDRSKTEDKRQDATGAVDAAEEAKAREKASNDPAWYARDPQLLMDASRFSFADVFGYTPIYPQRIYTDFALAGEGSLRTLGNSTDLYGSILTYITKQHIPANGNQSDPANVAASALYTHVRYVNSGRKNYDPADLMLYVLTIADLYAIVGFTQKVYAAAFTYSVRNLAIGKATLSAMGFDADNVTANLANLRYWLNTFISKVSTYAIPTDIPYFMQRIQEYSSLYLENADGNLKDQLYQVVPAGFYKFNLDKTNMGCLEYELTPSYRGQVNGRITQTSVQEWINYCESFFSNIWGDEDFGLISGDILKAFDGKVLGLAPQGDDAALIPVFDQYMLERFHNSTVIPIYGTRYDEGPFYDSADVNHKMGGVYQLPNGQLKCLDVEYHADLVDTSYEEGLRVPNAMMNLRTQKLLDLHVVDPDPALIIESTRWYSYIDENNMIDVFSSDGANIGKSYIIQGGVDIVVDMAITYGSESSSELAVCPGPRVDHFNTIYDINPNIPFKYNQGLYSIPLSYTSRNPVDDAFINVRKLLITSFKYAPPVHALFYNYMESDKQWNVFGGMMMSSLSNYTYVDAERIRRLHEVAALSLLTVPGVAKMLVSGS